MLGAITMAPVAGSTMPGEPITAPRSRVCGTPARANSASAMAPICATTAAPPDPTVGSMLSATMAPCMSASATCSLVPPRSMPSTKPASGRNA